MSQPAFAVEVPLPGPPSRDQVVVLRRIPWELYDALCVARAESAGPRMALFFVRGRFHMYVLHGDCDEATSRSRALPDLDLDELARIVSATGESHQTEAVRAFRRALRHSARGGWRDPCTQRAAAALLDSSAPLRALRRAEGWIEDDLAHEGFPPVLLTAHIFAWREGPYVGKERLSPQRRRGR